MNTQIQLQYEKKIKELESRVKDLELQLKVSLENQLTSLKIKVLEQYRLDYPNISDDQLLDYMTKDGY
jgi:hypothetical protein